MFCTGIFYTLLCYFLLILPTIYSEHVLMSYFSLVLIGCMLYMYVVLLSRDPGLVRESRQKDNDMYSHYSIADVAAERIKPYEFCSKCELVPPLLSSHCKICERCYVEIDHHCLYLYRCIARDNHRIFVAFNFVVMACMLLFDYAVYLYYLTLYPTAALDWDLAWLVFTTCPASWSLFVLNGMSAMWLAWVVKIQLELISDGRLQAYKHSTSQCALTRRQRIRNIFYFLLNRDRFTRGSYSA